MVPNTSTTIRVPLLEDMVNELPYGTKCLVEFEPQSLWYETSLTLATQAVKQGILTDYHTFQHIPGEVRENLSKLGLDLQRLEKSGALRIVDSYNVTMGFADPENPALYPSRSLKLGDWDAGILEEMKGGAEGIGKRRFHVDDNTSVLLQYNDEKTFIDHWRTKAIPETHALEFTSLNSVVTGVYSESFYRQFESLCDGIIDFQSREKNGQMEHYMRVRTFHGKSSDSRWRRLRLVEGGEVVVEKFLTGTQELGFTRWLKGQPK